MKVLLVGSGGREHALGWALCRRGRVDRLLTVPGNPGLADLGPVFPDVSPTDFDAVARLAVEHAVDFVLVGPEAPLAAGLVDALQKVGIPTFGPTRDAARLEASKSFAKSVMERAGVPTGRAVSFTDFEPVRRYILSRPGPYVVKADGLAAGKGVLVTSDPDGALEWARKCLSGGFGEAGRTVLVEEFLEGPELSVFCVAAGEEAVLLEPARDYKRLGDGDAGPNTGGMGSYSPVDLPPGLLEEVRKRIILPTLRQMATDGHPFIGFLYAGLALTREGPKVIEFNVRLGDPEAQVILPRMESDLVEIVEAGLEGRLGGCSIDWSPRSAVDVVLASHGYPESPRRGDPIEGVAAAAELDDVLVFHAGTERDLGGRLVTAGGRVLNVVGTGDSLGRARDTAYRAVGMISWPGMQYRSDIAATSGSPPMP